MLVDFDMMFFRLVL